MSLPQRAVLLGFAILATTALAGIPALCGCRKILGNGGQVSMGDVESNLEQLIAPAKSGLELQVSPRFLTFGPLPAGDPWDNPVPGNQTFTAHGQRLHFKTGSDGLIHERYEARACPLREIWSCVELWATGRFGKDGQLACVGLRLEKGATIEARKLDMRKAENCPLNTTTPGPAQKVVRELEKAQFRHTDQQQADKYLDLKAQ